MQRGADIPAPALRCVVAFVVVPEHNAKHLRLAPAPAPNDVVLGVLQLQSQVILQNCLDAIEDIHERIVLTSCQLMESVGVLHTWQQR